jgi:hypothetical protein
VTRAGLLDAACQFFQSLTSIIAVRHSTAACHRAPVRQVRKVNKRAEAGLIHYETELTGHITNSGAPTAVESTWFQQAQPHQPPPTRQRQDKSVIVVSPQSRMLR